MCQPSWGHRWQWSFLSSFLTSRHWKTPQPRETIVIENRWFALQMNLIHSHLERCNAKKDSWFWWVTIIKLNNWVYLFLGIFDPILPGKLACLNYILSPIISRCQFHPNCQFSYRASENTQCHIWTKPHKLIYTSRIKIRNTSQECIWYGTSIIWFI